jgi:hypothetical protein
MLRALLLSSLVLVGCRHEFDPPPAQPQGNVEAPPLPPSSGTPVGYLLDNAGALQLRDDQMNQLRDIDKSLAVRDDEIDTQLRIIEKPEDDPQVEKGQPPPRHNNAPGAQIKTTPDAAKLHQARKENDTDALKRAFALLDPNQRTTARKLLEDRGVSAPGSDAKPVKHDPNDGTPLEPDPPPQP